MQPVGVRGYFGIGVQGVSKPMNLGSLLRTAHAFGASFAFTIAGEVERQEAEQADTSHALAAMPFFPFASVGDVRLPDGCKLVGQEFSEAATELPVFVHPRQAAYVLGPERGSLSPALVARCDYVVRIPTAFCVNVGIAAALVMYDRVLTLGRFAPRPVRVGGPDAPLPPPVHGAPIRRRSRPK